MYNGPVWRLWFSGLNVACSPALGCECYRRAAAYGPHTIPIPRRTALGDKTGTIDRKCILFHGFPPASPFPGPYQRTNAFEKQGKQSTGRHTLTGVIRLFHQPTFGLCPGPTQRLEGLRSRCFHTSTCFEVSMVGRYIALVPVVFHSLSLTLRWAVAAHRQLVWVKSFLRLFLCLFHNFQLLWSYLHKNVCVCVCACE